MRGAEDEGWREEMEDRLAVKRRRREKRKRGGEEEERRGEE